MRREDFLLKALCGAASKGMEAGRNTIQMGRTRRGQGKALPRNYTCVLAAQRGALQDGLGDKN